jgi:hypothetical protein
VALIASLALVASVESIASLASVAGSLYGVCRVFVVSFEPLRQRWMLARRRSGFIKRSMMMKVNLSKSTTSIRLIQVTGKSSKGKGNDYTSRRCREID